MVEIIFYHWLHTRANGELAHGKHDLDSIAQSSFFAPRMSQALKDHIWTQLGLGYTIKQIYDQHKAIWWARINAWEVITRDDFIRQQDIIYLDRKHKKRSWCLHKNPTISLHTWEFNHPDDVFYFQGASENNGIHVPFTIRIQTPFQLQTMVSLSYYGAISMDATFGTNNVKFHLFTLMVFDTSHWNVSCMDHYKPLNMQWFGEMVNSFENKVSKEEP